MGTKELRIRGLEETTLQQLEFVASVNGYPSTPLFIKSVIESLIESNGVTEQIQNDVLQKLQSFEEVYLENELETKHILTQLVTLLEKNLED